MLVFVYVISVTVCIIWLPCKHKAFLVNSVNAEAAKINRNSSCITYIYIPVVYMRCCSVAHMTGNWILRGFMPSQHRVTQINVFNWCHPIWSNQNIIQNSTSSLIWFSFLSCYKCNTLLKHSRALLSLLYGWF